MWFMFESAKNSKYIRSKIRLEHKNMCHSYILTFFGFYFLWYSSKRFSVV